jgi:hypothetical protein
MPVVTLHCLAPQDRSAIDTALRAIVLDVSGAVGGEPAGTWAHWVPMAAVVQGEAAPAFDGHCPVVTIRGKARSAETVAAALQATASAVSTALEVPIEDVWVQWTEVEDGRAFAGGHLL